MMLHRRRVGTGLPHQASRCGVAAVPSRPGGDVRHARVRRAREPSHVPAFTGPALFTDGGR